MTCFDSGISKKDYEKRLEFILNKWDDNLPLSSASEIITNLTLMIEELLERID